MEVGLSESQEMFRHATRRLLQEKAGLERTRGLFADPAGFDRNVWRQGGELGWYAMMVPEKYGGGSVSGLGLVDATIVAEELGATMHPGPFLSTNVAAASIAEFGRDDQRETYLPGLASGELIGSWAAVQPGEGGGVDQIELEAVAVEGGFELTGRVRRVPDAQSCDFILATARSAGGLTQFVIPSGTPGVTVEPLECLDLTRRMADVTFEAVGIEAASVLGEIDGAEAALERQLQVALVLQCADTNGATGAGLAMTVSYAKERVAFGRPIGSYQALKHRMADHRMWLEGAFATTAYAARQVEDRKADAALAARVAKAHVAKWSTAILHDCIQLHGGIGMTWDYDLHLYFRRAIFNEVMLGSPDFHCSELVRLAEEASR